MESFDKATITKMFQQSILHSLETSEKVENLSKETEVLKKSKELKSTTENFKTCWIGSIQTWR